MVISEVQELLSRFDQNLEVGVEKKSYDPPCSENCQLCRNDPHKVVDIIQVNADMVKILVSE